MDQLLERLVDRVRHIHIHLPHDRHGNLHRAGDRDLLGNVNRHVNEALHRDVTGYLHLNRHRHLNLARNLTSLGHRHLDVLVLHLWDSHRHLDAALHRDLPVLHHRHFHVPVHHLRLDLRDLHLNNLLHRPVLDLRDLDNAFDVFNLWNLHFALLLDDDRLVDDALLNLHLRYFNDALLVLNLRDLNDLLHVLNLRNLHLTLLHDGYGNMADDLLSVDLRNFHNALLILDLRDLDDLLLHDRHVTMDNLLLVHNRLLVRDLLVHNRLLVSRHGSRHAQHRRTDRLKHLRTQRHAHRGAQGGTVSSSREDTRHSERRVAN